MFGKIIWAIILIASGLGLVVKTKRVKDFTGSFSFAEKWFGMGGTYTFLKLLGLALMIGTFLWLTGTLDRIVPGFITNQGMPVEGFGSLICEKPLSNLKSPSSLDEGIFKFYNFVIFEINLNSKFLKIRIGKLFKN
ncbi:hypothetical protein K9N08_03495 [Candidatus Gracilibacteria bacterium]|nr:hypothetical protein [Candidatus Gracilibacteria bacterium]MCF7856590.1 hypothetical protein [Candidatus Gracilibacteria bacterium]MCF7896447.1 hypothetical protein [Candidatus Gracilibacteria bacterium]